MFCSMAGNIDDAGQQKPIDDAGRKKLPEDVEGWKKLVDNAGQ